MSKILTKEDYDVMRRTAYCYTDTKHDPCTSIFISPPPEITQLKSTVGKLETILPNTNITAPNITTVKSETDKLQEVITELINNIKSGSLSPQVTTLVSTELDTAKKLITKLEEDVDIYKVASRTASATVAQLTIDNDKLEKEVGELTVQNEMLTKNMEDLQNSNTDLHKTVSILTDEITQLKAKLNPKSKIFKDSGLKKKV